MRQWGVHDLPAHQRTHHRSHRGADDGADECADQRAGEPFTAMVAATPTSTAAGSQEDSPQEIGNAIRSWIINLRQSELR